MLGFCPDPQRNLISNEKADVQSTIMQGKMSYMSHQKEGISERMIHHNWGILEGIRKKGHGSLLAM